MTAYEKAVQKALRKLIKADDLIRSDDLYFDENDSKRADVLYEGFGVVVDLARYIQKTLFPAPADDDICGDPECGCK